MLYSKGETSCASPYYILGYESLSFYDSFFGDCTTEGFFAAFSMPHSGENQRGYVAYGIARLNDTAFIEERWSYIHQTSPWQYPARTAVEMGLASGKTKDGVYITVRDEVIFNIEPELD